MNRYREALDVLRKTDSLAAWTAAYAAEIADALKIADLIEGGKFDYMPNYEAGLWSRRNLDAMMEDFSAPLPTLLGDEKEGG